MRSPILYIDRLGNGNFRLTDPLKKVAILKKVDFFKTRYKVLYSQVAYLPAEDIIQLESPLHVGFYISLAPRGQDAE